MLGRLIVAIVLCGAGTTAHGQYDPRQSYPMYPAPPQYYPPAQPPPVQDQPPRSASRRPQQVQRGGLSERCRRASEYIRTNNCGPQGCDAGLCVALQHGCRINWWGHHPVCR